MAFQLRKEVELALDAKSFTVEDITGIYSTANPTGYDSGASDPNFDINDAISATIEITKWQSSTTYTVTAYPTLPNTSGTLFTVNNTDLGLASTDTIPDGVYHILYTISSTMNVAATSAVTNTITIGSTDLTGVFIAGYVFSVANVHALVDGTYTTISSSFNGSNTVVVVASVGATTALTGTATVECSASSYELFFANGQECLNNILKQIDVSDCPDCQDTKVALAAKFKVMLLAAQYAAACGKPNKATVIANYLNELCDLESCEDCD